MVLERHLLWCAFVALGFSFWPWGCDPWVSPCAAALSLAVMPGGLQGFGAPCTCPYSLSSSFWVMQVTESTSGPALSGFFPVGKALPGFCHPLVWFLSSQNISKLLYAVAQHLDSALVLGWFSQVETLLTNAGYARAWPQQTALVWLSVWRICSIWHEAAFHCLNSLHVSAEIQHLSVLCAS